MRKSASLALVALMVSTAQGIAAGLGDQFTTYRDLHGGTSYGSLFFNATAVRYSDSQWKKRFQLVTGSGDLQLPSQQGYCFVLNHYTDDLSLVGKSKKYLIAIQKTFVDRTKKKESIEVAFSPTDDVYSSSLPCFCMSALFGVSDVSFTLRSNDGGFERRISFQLK